MTLSANNKMDKKEAVKTSSKPRRSVVSRFFIGLFWGLFGSLLLAAFLAGYFWINRYEFMEKVALKALAERGVDAQLSITSVHKTQAILENIKITDNGQDVFSVSKVTVDYQWKALRDGQIERIVLLHPKGLIELDGQGKIINGWWPDTETNGTDSASLPSEGIKIEHGTLILEAPAGSIKAAIQGEFFAEDSFTAHIDIAPTQLSYDEWDIQGGGVFDVSLQGHTPKIKTDITLSKLEHPVLDAENLTLTGDLIPVIDGASLMITGDIDIDFAALTTAQLITGPGTLNWQGKFERQKPHIDTTPKKPTLSFDGDWTASIDRLSSPDPIRRHDLAKTLSLNIPLSKTPIAQNFTPELTRNIEQLLTQSSMSGQGRMTLDNNGLSISLGQAATLKAKTTTLNLTQTDWAPLYRFDRKAKEVRLAFHADLTQPAGLSLRETELVARSDNGWRLSGINRFSADISTSREWTHIGNDKSLARLSPFKAEAFYKGGSNEEKRSLLLKGDIDYDGALPGAYVTGFKTGGEMTMSLLGAETILSFRPKNDAPISIVRIDTDTQWRAENVLVNLLSKTPIYRRRADSSDVSANLTNVTFKAIDRPAERHLDLSFGTMAVTGRLNDKDQVWTFSSQDANILSEDTPSPGTDISLPDMQLKLWRRPETDLRFEMQAPSANAKTQLVTATNIAITAAGSPDDFKLDYTPGSGNLGQVKFIGDALPPLPMTGIVHYKDTAFTGTARTNLPFGEDTPIDVSYRFKDGAGTATVDIPEIRFTPDGLQPQTLVKALKGKIADVDGVVSAQIKLAIAAGQPLQSSGTAQLKSMNFGTLPGPLTDVNTELSFSSFFPLQSQGRQTLHVTSFDPGFPLENGIIEFQLIPDGVKVYSARWPMGNGAISLEPFDWLYSAAENRVVMRIEKVSIGEFLNDIGEGTIEATGDIDGMLPVVLAGVDVKVDKGSLAVKNGGVIKYKSSQIDSVADYAKTDTDAVQALREHRYRDAVFQALQEFQYRSLTVEMDGPLDGAIEVGLVFDGSNKDVLNNQPFRFNINIEGELLNIIRSFNTNEQIKAELARRQLERENLPPDLE